MKALAIGSVTLGDKARLAVPFDDSDPVGDVAAVRGVADLIELRIDCFKNSSVQHVCDVIRQMRGAATPPIIGTVRWVEEGGKTPLSEDQRAELYGAIAPLVDAIDVELRSPIRDQVIDKARGHGKITIASFHDFSGMPPFYDIEGLIDQADVAGADILKVAAAAASFDEVRHLLEFTLRHRARGLVTMALGELGAVSRIVFPLAGSLITFAYHRMPSAPGQMPLGEMRSELERYRLA